MIFRSIYKRPVLLIGNGARDAWLSGLIKRFIAKTRIPVLTSMNAVDLVQGCDRIGFIGTYGNRAANMIISKCDLLIAVGVRLGLRQVGNNPRLFAPHAALIRVDIDKAELARTIKADEEKHLADASEFLVRLISEDIPDYSSWGACCRSLRDFLDEYDSETGDLAVRKIASLLPENPLVAVDVGQHMCWCARSLRLKGDCGRIFIGGGYGSMGCGLPFAIGASISRSDGTVYCITGDGGLQMNIQELETVVREKLPIKILVLDNHTLGKISEVQRIQYGGRLSQTTQDSGYSVPDFVRIAAAYGIRAARIPSSDMLDNYADWFYDNEPCLIDITLPSDTSLLPKMDFNTMCMVPALPERVYRECNRILAG